MPRNKERDALVREERRKQILRAASQVFGRKGLAASKMSDIAVEAGLSHGHIYNHFKTKEDLLVEIVRIGQESGRLHLMDAIESNDMAIDKLRRVVEMLVFHHGHSHNYWVILQAQALDVLSSEAKIEIHARMLHNMEMLARIIGQGQDEGEFAAGDAKEIAKIVMTLFHNIGLWEIRGIDGPNLSIVDYVLKLVRT